MRHTKTKLYEAVNAVNTGGSAPVTGNYFEQYGNSFGTDAVWGTNDDYELLIETSNIPRARFNTNGDLIVGEIYAGSLARFTTIVDNNSIDPIVAALNINAGETAGATMGVYKRRSTGDNHGLELGVLAEDNSTQYNRGDAEDTFIYAQNQTNALNIVKQMSDGKRNTINLVIGNYSNEMNRRLSLLETGEILTRGIHNTSSLGNSTKACIASGTYSPVVTIVSGIGTVTGSDATWMRVGNVVTVSGTFNCQGNGGTTVPQVMNLTLSLPITTSRANGNGTAAMAQSGQPNEVAKGTGVILPNSGAVMNVGLMIPAFDKSTSNYAWSYIFQYTIN